MLIKNQKTLYMLTVALLAMGITATVALADDDEGYSKGHSMVDGEQRSEKYGRMGCYAAAPS